MQITFNDFVDLIGHATTGDPAMALEAWESFKLSDHIDDESELERSNDK